MTRHIRKIWYLPFKLNERPRLRTLSAEISVNEIVEVSHKHNVSVTAYFVSVYLFSLQKIFILKKGRSTAASRKVLRIEVPVNMGNLVKIPQSREVERLILKHLSDAGIHVKIMDNY